MRAQFQVKDTYHITGIGNVLVGDVIVGRLFKGMKGKSEKYELEIMSVSIARKPVEYAEAGSKNVAVNITVNGESDKGRSLESKYYSDIKNLKSETIIFEGEEKHEEVGDTKPVKRKKKRLFGGITRV